MSDANKILAIDLDREAQARIAPAFNEAGLFYRFISDPKKTGGALRQLQPTMVVIFDPTEGQLTADILDVLVSDVAWAHLPVVTISRDQSDAPFVTGLRTGVVATLAAPFDPKAHLPAIKLLFGELSTRQGTSTGGGDSKVLARLVEHLRRTRRSGALTFDGRGPNEGRATFLLGKLETATWRKLTGVEALVAMVAQPQAQWAFCEVHGAGGDGAGVVIEVGDAGTDEEEISTVVGEPESSQRFEVPPAPPPSPARPPIAGARLLLVDDDDALCRMFSTLFSKHGFSVTSAEDGLEGYAAANRDRFDAIIADLNMPRMDGWGMLRMLRDDFRTRELPIAFLSCHDDYREGLKALNAGAQAYFTKATRLDALVAQVRKLLEPRQQAIKLIAAKVDAPLAIGALGPQWVLGQLEQQGFTGVLEAKDSFAAYVVRFTGGKAVHATAVSGKHSAEGERAFNAVVASRNAEGALRFGPQDGPQTLFNSTRELIDKACNALTANEVRMREGLLVMATRVEVNEDLYAIYRQVGPKQWLELARLICEEKVPPREVIARIDTSPVDVEETLKDLLRRGVVTLKKG